MKQIDFLTILPYCPSSDNPDCCSPPGLSQKEVNNLVEAIKKEGWMVEVHDIRDVRAQDAFPEAVGLFKEYRYDALPIIIADQKMVAYGIPDERFIIASIKDGLKTRCQ